jgi:hypothetical protein
MITTTTDKVREQRRVRTSLALMMALDSLDVAEARMNALLVKAQNGIYSEALHMEAVGNLDRALLEMARAYAESASMPDERAEQ